MTLAVSFDVCFLPTMYEPMQAYVCVKWDLVDISKPWTVARGSKAVAVSVLHCLQQTLESHSAC